MYGGSIPDDLIATKSAVQELLCSNFIGSYSPLLKTPLMALINYWGYTLIASALLPITRDSLVYGSNDAGREIVVRDEIVAREMKALGKSLNLQLHNVGSKAKEMALCGDIEV